VNPLNFRIDNDELIIRLDGRLDSKNARQFGTDINELVSTYPGKSVILDCENLELISSAGLRTVLQLKQSLNDVKLVNVNPTVFDVLQNTGFTEIMEVQRAYRVFSVKGCEEIGQGANGVVYRYDEDTIVKSFRNPDSLPEIQWERELARTAFVLGIPTAIS
jgi:anti-anti-sigma factor